MARSLAAFKDIAEAAEQEAIRTQTPIPEKAAAQIERRFHALMALLDEMLGFNSHFSETDCQELGLWVQAEMLPFIRLSAIGERMYSKPRGYAGDFLTIDWFYQDQPRSESRLGAVIDRCLLDRAACKAVRNRRGLLAEHIHEALRQAEGRPGHIASMACGPAAEVFDVVQSLDDPKQIDVTLIDIDSQALDFVRQQCAERGLLDHVDLVNGNLVHLALGRTKIELSEQDLVYSIGLIDYFGDKLVVALLNCIHRLLRPGGKVVLGNFHATNPDKAMMDYVLDWKLIHRDEADMNRMFKASLFGRPCTDIRFEQTGVNMFAECVK
jgi:SAM-dependent methyltransferase